MIRREIEGTGMTQKAMADWLGISRQNLCDILAGRQAITPRVLDKLGLVKHVVYVTRPKRGRR